MARRVLDATRSSESATSLQRSFSSRVVGQPEAVSALVDIVEHHMSGFGERNRPAGSLLFLGPTGTGKTRVAESMAHGLFGSYTSMVKIDCAEFQHSHEIAKLIGSPPGYLGHNETAPLLTQERLDQYFTDTTKIGIVLFDEIEKASDALWQLLLGILDKATLTLGTNKQVNFSRQVIIMTSNLGSGEMSKLVDGGMGYSYETAKTDAGLEANLTNAAVGAAKKKFTAEFFNRIDKKIVFKTLTRPQVAEVLLMELSDMQTRMLGIGTNSIGFFIHTTAPVKQALLDEGYSEKYGVRELRRVIRQRIQTPMAKLAATGQVKARDTVIIELKPNGEFEFGIEERVA